MKIPNGDKAIVDIRKLQTYCLNLEHVTGKHKARVFEAALGLTADDAETLKEILLQVIQEVDGQMGIKDDYGQRYWLDFALEWHGKTAMIRSAWIIEPNKTYPKLTSCYVLKK